MQDTYRYDFNESARTRLLHAIRSCVEYGSGNLTMEGVLDEMHEKILHRHGGLRRSAPEGARLSSNVVVEHFYRCSDDEVLEFLKMCFETRLGCGGQVTVQAINRVLDEENIGFELTSYSEPQTLGAAVNDRFRPAAKKSPAQLPKVLRKNERALHAATVKPCLAALSDARFSRANDQLLTAFDEYRQGKNGDAVADAGAAFESVLKVICAEKKWPCDQERDACAKLLEICREHGLFPPFYKPMLEAPVTIGAKISDAHGKGPRPAFPATKELADHMLHTVCNNINLLVSLAKL